MFRRAFLLLTLGAALLSAAPAAAQTFLFVGSGNANTVRRYNGLTGAFDGLGATGGGLNGPAGLAIRPSTNELLVAGALNNQVLRYNGLTGAFLGTFTSGGSLVIPDDIVYGTDGKLYVSGGLSDNVQRFNTNGTFDTVFGTGTGGTTLPGITGLAFNAANGRLHAAHFDFGDFSVPQEVQRFPLAGGAGAPFSVGGVLDTPGDIIFGPDGNLYVSSSQTDEVLRYDGTSGVFLGTFVSNVPRPNGIAFGPDGNFYVSSWGGTAATSLVKRYNGTTGAFIDNFVASGLDDPGYILFATFSPVPEPTTIALGVLGLGSVVLGAKRYRIRRKRKASQAANKN